MKKSSWNDLLDQSPSKGRRNFFEECRFYFLVLLALFLIGFLLWVEMEYEMITGVIS